MTLEVRRTYSPIYNRRETWERFPVTLVVWQCVDGRITAEAVCAPSEYDYERGLLTTYIDGQRVDLLTFDTALGEINLTRRDVELMTMEYDRD